MTLSGYGSLKVYTSKVVWLFYSFLFLLLGLRFFLWSLDYKQIKNGQNITINGTISNWPNVGKWQKLSIDGFAVITSSQDEYQIGDQVLVSGKFDSGVVWADQIKIIEPGHSWLVALAKIRSAMIGNISRSLPEPNAGLVAGMTLGVKQIEDNFKQALITTGTIHTVVVSGQNISLICGFLIGLASLIGRKPAIILAALLGIIYCLMAGFEPPTVRALLMVLFAYGATILGKQGSGIEALAISGFMMIFISPQVALDLSFQLSFLSTLGILLFSKSLQEKITALPFVFGESLAITLSAQILILPVLVFNFGRVSLISPLANLAISPLIVPILFFGMAQVLLGFIPVVSQLLMLIVYPLSWIFVKMVDILSSVPFATIEKLKIDILVVIIYYFVIVIYFLWRQIKKSSDFGSLSRQAR